MTFPRGGHEEKLGFQSNGLHLSWPVFGQYPMPFSLIEAW
jgi:hypothetical protein